VARVAVGVRPATAADIPELTLMWEDMRGLLGRPDRVAPVATQAAVRHRLREATANPDCRVLVATWGQEVIGFCVLTRAPYAPLYDTDSVHLHYLHVRPGGRHRGAGRALVAAAAAFAEQVGADHVVTGVSPQLREANRFYARLGFRPVVVRRAVSLSVLRRRLAVHGSPGSLEHTIAMRRTVGRARAALARRPGVG
jgi:ribosomal protein S18 acetylase RimI-like enzyme